MNYLAVELSRNQIRISFFIDASIGVLNSFIPIRCAFGIFSPPIGGS
jgi:hypothetical protein